jgi:hypothetical protein
LRSQRDLLRIACRGLLLAASAILSARDAGAAEAPGPLAAVHLEVEAAATCATPAELVARVTARSPRIRFLDDGAGVTSLNAEIAPGPNDTVIGRLSLVDPDGRRSSRRLSAPTCAEAIDAIALIIVISLDPTYAPPAPVEAGHAPLPANPGSPGAATSDGVGSLPTTRTSVQPGGANRDASAERGEGASERPSPEPPPPGSSVRRLGVGASALLISGPAPRVMPGIGVRLVAALDRGASIWSPALRLTAAHAWQGGVSEPGGTAAFALDTLGLDLCFVRLAITIVDLRGCAAGTAGRLSATGSNTYSPSAQERPFVGLGGAAIVGVALGRLFQLSGSVDASDALVRDAFEFSPQVFHRVSAMTLTVDLGLDLRFP